MTGRQLTPAEWAIYERGQEAGYARGAAEEAREMAESYREIAGPASRAVPFAETERKRWMLRGEQRTRETFGEPHPGDFTGRQAAASREPRPQAACRPFERDADREAG